MSQPTITSLTYTYKKPESEVWVLNFDDIPVPLDTIKDKQIVHLAPLSVGGNHRHPRIEWFIGIGDLELIWLDPKGQLQRVHMNPEGKLLLCEIPPFLPHAVKNLSKTEQGILLEFADEKMCDVEKVVLVE